MTNVCLSAPFLQEGDGFGEALNDMGGKLTHPSSI
jgi:hypothetical protein